MRCTYPYIFMLLFAISAWLLTVIFSGCAFNPRPDCLQAIEDRAYVSGEYTCWHKSRDACKCLNKHGWDAYVIIGEVDWDKRCHAWVEIHQEGKIYWRDMTFDDSGWWEKSKWSDRMPITDGLKIEYAVGESK